MILEFSCPGGEREPISPTQLIGPLRCYGICLVFIVVRRSSIRNKE